MQVEGWELADSIESSRTNGIERQDRSAATFSRRCVAETLKITKNDAARPEERAACIALNWCVGNNKISKVSILHKISLNPTRCIA